MAEPGKPYNVQNTNFAVTQTSTPVFRSAGDIIWTGSQLKINVGTDRVADWKTITWS